MRLTTLGALVLTSGHQPSPAASIFAASSPLLNGIIQDLAAEYGGFYVDIATPFVSNEAAYTFIDKMPAGSTVEPPFGGVLPIGNLHPNATGYQVIAKQVAAVPEPSSGLAALVAGGAFMLGRSGDGARYLRPG